MCDRKKRVSKLFGRLANFIANSAFGRRWTEEESGVGGSMSVEESLKGGKSTWICSIENRKPQEFSVKYIVLEKTLH